MNRKTRLTTRLLAAALLAAGSPLAFAAGTLADTTIQNVATVNFSVGGTAQTVQQNNPTSAQFKVDRLVTFTVTANAPSVSVPANKTGAVLSYTVTNNSNDTLDFSVAALQEGTNDFSATGVSVFVETAGPGFDPLADTQTWIDELAPGASKVVYIVGDIPSTALNGQEDQYYLVATAGEGGTAATQGADLTDGVADTAMGVENVFGEGVSGGASTDGDNDGVNSAQSGYLVQATTIAVDKKYFVIDDPINGTTSPYAIPGATILYCITVTNGGVQQADGVTITDVIPTGTTFVNGSIETFANVAIVCNNTEVGTGTGVTDASGYTPGTTTVSTSNGAVPAGEKTSTIFKVTINATP